jgi:hypothetical protein
MENSLYRQLLRAQGSGGLIKFRRNALFFPEKHFVVILSTKFRVHIFGTLYF